MILVSSQKIQISTKHSTVLHIHQRGLKCRIVEIPWVCLSLVSGTSSDIGFVSCGNPGCAGEFLAACFRMSLIFVLYQDHVATDQGIPNISDHERRIYLIILSVSDSTAPIAINPPWL